MGKITECVSEPSREENVTACFLSDAEQRGEISASDCKSPSECTSARRQDRTERQSVYGLKEVRLTHVSTVCRSLRPYGGALRCFCCRTNVQRMKSQRRRRTDKPAVNYRTITDQSKCPRLCEIYRSIDPRV